MVADKIMLEEESLMLPKAGFMDTFSARWQSHDRQRRLFRKALNRVVHLLAIVGLVAGAAWIMTLSGFLINRTSLHAYTRPETSRPYSPISHLSAHDKIVTFDHGFESDISIYQGPPTPERDAAWQELYDFGFIKIPRSSAAYLANKTVPIPGDTSNYVISLDVFHQLHCLNMVRQHMWSLELGTVVQHSKEDYFWHLKHIDHCINEIRQSLMCSADIAPVAWGWSEQRGRAHPMYPKQHQCRDFDAIRGWAMENHLDRFEAGVLAHDADATFEPERI